MDTWILHIETSTKNCSVALGLNGKLFNLIEKSSENYSHGEKLHPFIKELVDESPIDFDEISAISVSKGPGSYTGLRIGVSAAKGLCYALNTPLISLNSLSIIAQQVTTSKGFFLAPMIDARRMEVYTQILDHNCKIVKNTWAEILTENSFEDYLSKNKILAFGFGSHKTKNLIQSPNFKILDYPIEPSAKYMVSLSYNKFQIKDFEDVAYFEPYYLKEFYSTKVQKT
tara:strand:- start:25687 stop:26370 length:684 start_codon:yes stop_codon:yes gene_type:complete